MLLDYERYRRRSPKKKSHLIVFFLLLTGLGLGTFFLVSTYLRDRKAFTALSMRSLEERLDDLWAQLLKENRMTDSPERREREEMRILDELIALSSDHLKEHPLSLKALLYHGYGSYYRALYESSFDAQLPYFTQSVIAQRRALTIAGASITPQLYYMLGRTYFRKRSAFYDLAVKYLEKALELGYKQTDAYECLVLIFEEWGDVDKAISCLEQAYAEKKNDLYLYYLAKSYKKTNRPSDAVALLKRLTADVHDAELLKECRFLLGEVFFEQGNYAQAERQYRDIIADDVNSAEAHFRLALIYEKLGDYARYRYELRLTLEKDRGHSGARSRL